MSEFLGFNEPTQWVKKLIRKVKRGYAKLSNNVFEGPRMEFISGGGSFVEKTAALIGEKFRE